MSSACASAMSDPRFLAGFATVVWIAAFHVVAGELAASQVARLNSIMSCAVLAGEQEDCLE